MKNSGILYFNMQPDYMIKTLFMRYLILLTFAVISSSVFSQSADITKEKWHWGEEPKQNTSAGYTQVLKVDNILYISGAVTRYLTPEGITQLYSALERSLKSFGATFQNVVKENLYTTDIGTMRKYNDARKVFYKNDFPAATWVQITRLYSDSAKLEVELVAHLPKSK